MTSVELVLATFREFGIVQERVDAILKKSLPAELPAAQFKLLNHLSFTTNKDETVSDLAKNSHVTLSAMSQIIKQVKQKGFVTLVSQEHDSRKKSLLITEQGHKAHQSALENIGVDLNNLANNFSATDLKKLYELSHQFRTVFEDQHSF